MSEYPPNKLRPWQTISTRNVLEVPPWFSVLCDTVELPSGKIIDDFYRIVAPDYAIVCPCREDGKILLERHYKQCLGKFIITSPAGGLEDSESPIHAAQRELLEETGYHAESWKSLGSFTVDGTRGICQAHFFLAEEIIKISEPELNNMEELDLVFLDQIEISIAIKQGSICLLPDITLFLLAFGALG